MPRVAAHILTNDFRPSFHHGVRLIPFGMAVPTYQALLLPVLREAAKGVTSTPSAAEKIADQLGLSEAERSEKLPSGKQLLLHNRIHWAKFYLSKAGLIDTPARGKFHTSVAGAALLDQNPKDIDLATLRLYPSFMSFYSSEAVSGQKPETAQTEEAAAESTATPEEQIDAASGVLTSGLRVELLERILANTPSFFEQLVVDLLVAMGYGGTHENASMKLGKSGDGGIDGVIDEDRLGLDRIYIQAKRFEPPSAIGRPEVQKFVGSLVGLNAAKGVFLTTSSFSAQAREYVKHLAQRVILIDGAQLTQLMIEHGVGVRVSRIVSLKRVDEDFFSPE